MSAILSKFQAKASDDNGATDRADDEKRRDSLTGDASRLVSGRTETATSEHGRDSRERLAPIFFKSIAETIEHADISATQHEHDIKAMREVEAGTYPRAAENRFGG